MSVVVAEKLDRLFDLFDSDGNGVLERDDFEHLAAGLVTSSGTAPGSARAEGILAAYAHAWKLIVGFADRDGDGQVTRPEFHAALSDSPQREKRFAEVFGATCDVEFDAADRDGDGLMTRAEFAGLMRGFGHDEADATDLAAAMVTEAGMTREQYYTAWEQFVAADEAGPADRMI